MRRRVFRAPRLPVLASLTGRPKAYNLSLAIAEVKSAEWTRHVKKYKTRLSSSRLERILADLPLAWTTQLLSLRSVRPRHAIPDAPALTALLSQLTYCANAFFFLNPFRCYQSETPVMDILKLSFPGPFGNLI
jgi:hypothetical protein